MASQNFRSEKAIMILAILRIMSDTGNSSNYEGFSEYMRMNGSYGGVKQKIPAEYIKNMVEFKVPFDMAVFNEALDAFGRTYSNYQSFREYVQTNYATYTL